MSLQPMLDRGRYSDEEWEYATSGRCDWEVESGMTLCVVRCGQPSDPDSVYRYCREHDEDAREAPGYGR